MMDDDDDDDDLAGSLGIFDGQNPAAEHKEETKRRTSLT
jgi:hypothetical protein